MSIKTCDECCEHKGKIGKSIYCLKEREKKMLVPYLPDIAFGDTFPKMTKYTQMKRTKECLREEERGNADRQG